MHACNLQQITSNSIWNFLRKRSAPNEQSQFGQTIVQTLPHVIQFRVPNRLFCPWENHLQVPHALYPKQHKFSVFRFLNDGAASMSLTSADLDLYFVGRFRFGTLTEYLHLDSCMSRRRNLRLVQSLVQKLQERDTPGRQQKSM